MSSLLRFALLNNFLQENASYKPACESKFAVLNCDNPTSLKVFGYKNVTFFHSLITELKIAKKLGMLLGADRSSKFDLVIVCITKSKTETLGLIYDSLRIIKPEGLIVLEGDKKAGIDSLTKKIKKIIPIAYSFSKAHGKIILVKAPDLIPKEILNWKNFKKAKRNSEGFFTIPGIFSPNKIDSGSQLLTESFVNKLSGRIADLGSGWGYLSSKALEKNPDINEIVLFEHDLRAVEASKENIKDPRAIFEWTDLSSEVKVEPKVDHVICNPPFHSGVKKDTDLGVSFLETAAKILKPNGKLWLVANLKLPYEKTLKKLFKQQIILKQTNLFKIMLIQKPK